MICRRVSHGRGGGTAICMRPPSPQKASDRIGLAHVFAPEGVLARLAALKSEDHARLGRDAAHEDRQLVRREALPRRVALSPEAHRELHERRVAED